MEKKPLTYTELIWKTYQAMLAKIHKKRPELAKLAQERVQNEYMLLAGIENIFMPRYDKWTQTLRLTESDVQQILCTQFCGTDEHVNFDKEEFDAVYKFLNYICKVYASIPRESNDPK